jgi:hypothetical protein
MLGLLTGIMETHFYPIGLAGLIILLFGGIALIVGTLMHGVFSMTKSFVCWIGDRILGFRRALKHR